MTSGWATAICREARNDLVDWWLGYLQPHVVAALAWQNNMLRFFAAALLAFFCVGTHTASAAECYPHCDYTHYYGPFDFTYVQPGLYAYPRCGVRGNCSPYMVYSTSGFHRGTITVRFPRAAVTRPAQ